MISVETIHKKIQMLPTSSRKEVLAFVDGLLEKSATSTPKDRSLAWEAWANSHSHNTVILDDTREFIYEDK